MDQNKFRGALLGLATGDALGTTVEFKKPGTFTPLKDLIGGGQFRLEAGQWTDDTSMALCLAESLITKNAFDPLDQAERYLKWLTQGHMSSTGICFDVGHTTKAALLEFKRSREPFSGLSDTNSQGNGSLMRLAPIPLFYAGQIEDAVYYSGQSSRITHSHPVVIDACRYFGALIFYALQGQTKDFLLSNQILEHQVFFNAPLAPEIVQIAHGSFKEKRPPAIRGTGYAVESLEAALWAFYTTDNFKAGALAAVNLGEDADTTGAIYGQIAGAFYGIQQIPNSWQELIYGKDEWIIPFADQLYKRTM